MNYKTAAILIAFFGLSEAAPARHILNRREVPQEQSHKPILDAVKVQLDTNNPDKIVDPVFGLLGDKAAAAGAGAITDLACLHQATADRAFTNAKTANDINGQANALIYAALERNTAAVGQASAVCNQTAVNPEIAAIKQHQDPAGPGAPASNKQIVLDLATQLASIGADPQLAAKSATFSPGKLADNSGKGNTCDDKNDAQGCIFSQNLIQVEATPQEIDAAVGSATGAGKVPGAAADNKVGDAGSGKKSDAGTANTKPGTDQEAQANTGIANPAAANALDFGTCGNPAIQFGDGLDGRKEPSFQAVNLVDFNHGSAQKIAVISDFVCQQLASKCKAGQATIDACDKGKAAAGSASGQASADAFNSALGVSA